MTAMRGLALLAGSLLTLLGCRTEPFACESSEQCLDGDREGACEPNGYCSFEDDTCPSGRRYGHLAGGGLAERCVSSDGNATTGVESSTASSTSGPSTSASTTSPVTSASTISTSSSGAPDDSSTGPAVTTSVDTSTSAGDTAADGSPCNNDSECQSSHCFDVGILGAVCGECSGDDDCRWGCTPPPFDINGASSGSYCNDGSLGEGCQDASGCVDLACALIYTLEGIGTVTACSECTTSDDCPEGTACNPTIDISTGYGYRSCVMEGSVEVGEFCDNDDGGDFACFGGHCVDADLMGLGTMGVCSECTTSIDCSLSEECLPPQIDIFKGTNIPGACQ